MKRKAVFLVAAVLLGFAMPSEAQIQIDTVNGWYPIKITSGVTKFYTRLVTTPPADVYAGKSSQLFGMSMSKGDTVIVMKKLGREYDMPDSIEVADARTIAPAPGGSTLIFLETFFVSHADTVQQFGGFGSAVTETSKFSWSWGWPRSPLPPIVIKKVDAIMFKFYVEIGTRVDLAEILFDNFEFIYKDGSSVMVDDFEGSNIQKASFTMPFVPWDFGNMRQDSISRARLRAFNDTSSTPGAPSALVWKIQSRIPWVSVSPDTAIIQPGNSRDFTVTCSPTKQTPVGSWSGYVVFYLQNCTTSAESVAVMGVIDKTTGIEEVSGKTPNVYSLSQNYPNPFNPTTRIRFDIPKSSHVNLIIYNVLGQIVTTLVNGQLQAGTYEYEFNETRQLASGLYIYRIQAGSFIETKKMVLTK